MSHSSRVLAFIGALATSQISQAGALPPGLQTDFKLRLGAFGEGARDLGLGDADSTSEGYADAQATLYWRSVDHWAALTRIQGFAPTGELVVTDEDRPRRSKSYVGLRELWFEYRGFTSYPGEVLRAGLQRLHDADGQWFDRDIESLRWIFDTTLLQGQFGVAESFYTYRSDGSEPSASLRDRTYVFAGLSRQWAAGHHLGARAIHAFDHTDPEREIASNERDPKLSERRYTWIDLYAHNDYYEPSSGPGWSYWADASALIGDRKDFRPATLTDPALQQERDVRGYAGDVGLRWRPPMAFPLQVGAAYAFGSGDGNGDTQRRYEQTGLHSNRSRFTGTRSPLYRYGEALQPDLSNLHVTSAYLSIPHERWDASLVYHHFVRDRASEPVVADGVDVQPEPGRKALGNGVDVAVAYYFGNLVGRGKPNTSVPQSDEDLRSNLRLRASGFRPGEAYTTAADDQYRVTLELTLWF